MAEDSDEALLEAARAVLRPIVRRLFARGVRYGRVEAGLRDLFLELAEEELASAGQPATTSAISLLSGINRKAVRRLRSPEGGGKPRASASFRRNQAASLIGVWLAERRATDRRGRPLPIPYQAEQGPSFERFAREVTVDVAPGSLLKDLIRAGAVEQLEDGRVALLTDAYGPSAGEPEKLAMLVEDPAELVETMLHNIFGERELTRLQRKVFFDNIGTDSAKKVRREMARAGERFLRDVARRLGKYDRDRNPRAPGGERRYAGVGVYFFEAPADAKNKKARVKPAKRSGRGHTKEQPK